MGKAFVPGLSGGRKDPITYTGKQSLDSGASIQVRVSGNNLVVVVWAYDTGKRVNAAEVYRIEDGSVSRVVGYSDSIFFPTTFAENVVSIKQNFSGSAYTFYYHITEF